MLLMTCSGGLRAVWVLGALQALRGSRPCQNLLPLWLSPLSGLISCPDHIPSRARASFCPRPYPDRLQSLFKTYKNNIKHIKTYIHIYIYIYIYIYMYITYKHKNYNKNCITRIKTNKKTCIQLINAYITHI